jgi:uncharacterized repeat protein (TIGR01451 family)
MGDNSQKRPWRRSLRLGFSLQLAVLLLAGAGGFRGIAAHAGGIEAPVLKWQHAGCYSSWCETGWYSSPAVADLDGDGSMEVIASAYTIFILDGATGGLEWHMASGHDRSETGASNVGRTWPGIVVADVDGDNEPEIVTAHSGGTVSVYDREGYFQPGWPQYPTTSELRGLSVHDLEGDGTQEVVVTAAVGSKTNTWVYEHDGVLRPGWPQLSDGEGYAYGVFNDNAALGDLDGDGLAEIVVPSDVHYICAYEADGAPIPAHAMYEGKVWGEVGIWESLEIELRGWGKCDGVREESYRTNFAHGPAALADVDGDGAVEVIAVGNVYDCHVGHPPGKYNGVYLFNADRSRFQAGSYDWQSPPVDTGAPLSEDWNVIENNQPNPVVADLDGDGEKEILYSSYDGRVHAFWLDKTEHGSWPFSVYDSAEGVYRFASEPVVADLDGDGDAEVLFASWAQKGSGQTGKLHLLDYLGNPLHELDLPPAYGSPTWNGALAAPTLANIDADADLELVLNTAHSGFVAYDLPGTERALVLWGTGRGTYQRNGSPSPDTHLTGSLEDSDKSVQPSLAAPGDVLTYTIRLVNPGLPLADARVTDTLSAEVHYLGNLWASAGSYGADEGGSGQVIITWTGTVATAQPVTITFGVTVGQQISTAWIIQNRALIDDGLGNVWQRQASVTVNGYAVYLPLVVK